MIEVKEAVRLALGHFKDLNPEATRVSKPHFQPILDNLVDFMGKWGTL